MLRDIAGLLQKAGVSFGYLYGDEMYSGTLAYDEGLDDAFAPHARRVAETFRRYGVRRVITVDPHTTHMLRAVYPKVRAGLRRGGARPTWRCWRRSMARGASDTVRSSSTTPASTPGTRAWCKSPRDLLRDAGIDGARARLSGTATFCCGGPIEVLFPSEAHRIALERVASSPRWGGGSPRCARSAW